MVAKGKTAQSNEAVMFKWIGGPISQKEVTARWPNRKRGPLNSKEEYDPEHHEDYVAIKHYEGVVLDDHEIRIGDCVEVFAAMENDDDVFVLRVDELFEDANGEQLLCARYFYNILETALTVEGPEGKSVPVAPNDDGLHNKRVWLATKEDNENYNLVNPINAIKRKVTVKWVEPGNPPPAEGTCDYWYDQYHTRKFYTFEDITSPPVVGKSRPNPNLEKVLKAAQNQATVVADELKIDEPLVELNGSNRKRRSGCSGEVTAAKRVSHSSPATNRQTSESTSPSTAPNKHTISDVDALATLSQIQAQTNSALVGKLAPKKLNVLELCAGAGGLSFLSQRDESTVIKSSWAVDIDLDACLSFKVNHPQSEVYPIGMDEFLVYCKLWKCLCEKYPPGTKRTPKKTSQRFAHLPSTPVAVRDMHLGEEAERGKSGQGKGQLMGELREEECWLEFLVECSKGEQQWVRYEELPPSCDDLLVKFINERRAAKVIPLPGDVHVVAGGPPCQGVSGLNRHGKKINVLDDPRNRLIKTYLEIIKYFKPHYILTEQVLDIIKKDQGMYAKFAVGSLLALRYQTRVGIIAAGDHGCPQGRYRVFIWGAASGWQLPAYPEPSHRVKDFRTPVPSDAKDCRVNFLSEENRLAAYPEITMGDVLSDLPEIDNFCFAEANEYSCPPQSPFQAYMRRPPPEHEASLLQRIKAADSIMAYQSYLYMKRLIQLGQKSRVDLGQEFFCTSTESAKSFADMTWRACIKDEAEGEVVGRTVARKINREMFAKELGDRVYAELVAGMTRLQGGTVRDHRALMCNSDDYMRMYTLPKEKGASFRSYPGVITHKDGTCCAGHCHAYKSAANGATSCPGGGTAIAPKSSLMKESRVDQHDKQGWRGASLQGCPAKTCWIPTGDLQCPRWCITYKKGKSRGRHACFGRIWYHQIQPTVVTRAEPHNLELVHPTQARVLSVRENARCQGFPDYYVLVGRMAGPQSRRTGSVATRYKQIGNAVAPPVSRALGRCLLLAAAGTGRRNDEHISLPVVPVRDSELDKVYSEARAQGLKFYVEQDAAALVDDGGDLDVDDDEEDEIDPADDED